jgi:hypothetical protein
MLTARPSRAWKGEKYVDCVYALILSRYQSSTRVDTDQAKQNVKQGGSGRLNIDLQERG